ncbi:MAG: signal peptide peptidase SppA [Myxococcaceae bacterium]
MRSTIALCFVASAALAQPAVLNDVDLSRGSTLPPTSTATVNDVTALTVNPAALQTVSALELFYVHERSTSKDDVVDSLFLGDSFFGAFGAGVSLEWIRSPSHADYRRTGWTFSVGQPQFSLGFTYNNFTSSESPDLGKLHSIDLGLSLRPIRPLAFGITVRNVDEPTNASVTLAREYDVGVAFRPFGDRYTLAVDLFDRPLIDSSLRLQYTLQAELFQGIWLGAGVSHGFSSATPLTLQLSATFNLAHFGVGYALGGAESGVTHSVYARLSADRYRPVTLSRGKIAMIDLSDSLRSNVSTAAQLLGQRSTDPYLTFTRFMEDAIRDDSLKGVVLKFDDLPEFGLAKAEELRAQVIRLRASGKRVIALMLTASDAEYVVASAADQVYAVPEATLNINGFAANVTFAGGLMNKLGVHWDVARVGAYKNAPDQLTKESISPEQAETMNALLDSSVRNSEKAVLEVRKALTLDKLHAAQADGIVITERAKELGIIDDIVGPQELEDRLKDQFPGLTYDPEYAPHDTRDLKWGSPKKIRVVPVIGTISGGKSRQDPLGGVETAGGETVVKAISDATDDPEVAAIVVRVDSGGGDALASDLIYRAILQARKKKPVIASMGNTAASGGYYVAMACDQIFASPTTVTGSIGVFMMKPSVEKLGEKVGVHTDIIQRGPLSNLLSPWKDWTPEEQAAAQKWTDSFYDGFITRVAESRKLQKADVDKIARGRVWAGDDAKSRGLIDTFGGLSDALAEAKKRAGISEKDEVDLDFGGGPNGILSALGGEPGVFSPPVNVTINALPLDVKAAFDAMGVAPSVLLSPGLKAMMPFSVKVE